MNSLLALFGEKLDSDKVNVPYAELSHFHKLLPYVSYKDGLFFNQGATGFVLACEPLAGGSLEIQDQLAEFFRTKENLPEGSSLQFLLISSPRVGEKVDAWKKTSIPSYIKFKERRADFMLSKSLRDYRVLISFSMPGLALSPEKEEGMIRIRTNLRSTLKQLGMYTSVLDAKGLISNLRNILMPSNGYQEKSSWNKLDALAKQILPPNVSMHVEEDHVLINDQVFKTFLPKSSPDYWSLPSQDLLIGDISKLDSQIPVPFMIHYGIHVLGNQSGALAKQVSRRGTLENSLKNALTKWMPGLEEQYEETVAAVKEMQKGERLVISNFSVTLMSQKKDLEEATSKLKSIWSAAEWDLESAVYNQLPMLLSSLPMMWTLGEKEGWAQNLSAMGVGKKSITKESQNLLPIIAEWKGQSVGMPLYGRRGQVFFWSPFGEGLLPQSKAQTDHNFNLCIAGQSGSGKSVFAQELMMNILSVGGRVFVLDYGRSFKKACQLMKGQHIEFDVRDPISLNPFTHIPTENDPESIATREEMLACLKPTIQAMAAPKQGTSDLENSFIEKSIRHVWNIYGQEASIDGIQDYLLSQENIEAKNLGQTLYPFSGQGVYGRFFSGKAGANLTEDFVVIETDHLRSHPDLLTVLVQMVMIQIHQTMARGDRSRPTMIMIDEAWKLLAGKSTGDFIAEMNRIARKYKVAICMATQHMTDYFKPECPAATEAFNASAWKVMLYQESDVIEAFHDHPQLKTFVEQKGQEKVLKSLRSVIPYFSEAAIFGPGVRGAVGRLSLDPYSRLLFSTNPVEYQELEKRTAQGMSVSEAIEDYLKDKNWSASHD